jgi:hypothetical protein
VQMTSRSTTSSDWKLKIADWQGRGTRDEAEKAKGKRDVGVRFASEATSKSDWRYLLRDLDGHLSLSLSLSLSPSSHHSSLPRDRIRKLPKPSKK